MNLSDFDFHLPETSIAQYPAFPRDHARLMVIDKTKKTISHKHFYDLPSLLPKDTFLVRNNSKVIRSRIRGNFPSGSSWELFFIKEISPKEGHFLVKPGKKFKAKTSVTLEINGKKQELFVSEELPDGSRKISFENLESNLKDYIQLNGEMPLPPYISARDGKEEEHYQTVYAKPEGSLAAPTAGLHFTEQTFKELETKHIPIFDITLHVGLGTFLPVKVDKVDEHVMHEENYEIDTATWNEIETLKSEGKKLCAIGTTSTRVLEHVWTHTHPTFDQKALSGATSIFIYPPYTFKAVDILLTNFHLPKSTLIMLVSAFIGDREFTLHAYEEAIKNNYQFYSYGDAMLIL